MASAYLTRHGLAVANTTIQEELGFNNQDFGWLYGAFSLGYLLFQVPGGWFGQKFGTRPTLPNISQVRLRRSYPFCALAASPATPSAAAASPPMAHSKVVVSS